MATRIRFYPVNSTAIELINTQNSWYIYKIKKESSGQVVVGENQELMPVSSGRGIGIPADEWTDMILSPGTILFAAAPTEETIAVIEQILPISEILDLLRTIAAGKVAHASAQSPMASAASGSNGGIHTLRQCR